MHALNKRFMNKDKPTNVLSFPSESIFRGDFIEFDSSKTLYLGDIAVSYQKVMEECLAQNKTFNDHLSHLMVHSFLHLCGFDHIADQDAIIMEKMEIKILSNLGIKNPYLAK
jgi:probable rRNA maturation factor